MLISKEGAERKKGRKTDFASIKKYIQKSYNLLSNFY